MNPPPETITPIAKTNTNPTPTAQIKPNPSTTVPTTQINANINHCR